MSVQIEQKPRVIPRPTAYSKPFWDKGALSKFAIQRDPEGGRCQFYPRPVVLWGKRRSPEWIEASGRGKLIALIQTTMPGAGFENKTPYYLAIALLDEGVRVFAELDNVGRAPKIGDAIEVIWENVSADRIMFKFRLAD